MEPRDRDLDAFLAECLVDFRAPAPDFIEPELEPELIAPELIEPEPAVELDMVD